MAQDTTAAATSSGLLPPKDEPAPTRTAFTVSPALQATLYHAPVQAYLAAHPTVTNPLASAAVFYHHPGNNKKSKPPPPPRLLLLQRAPTDTLPLKWELPGGSVDVAGVASGGDASLVHAAVRELREETGLVARGVVRELGVQREFYEDVTVGGSSGGTWQRLLTWRMVVFEVDVGFGGKEAEEGGPRVRLAPGEHVRYLWCTEEDVRAGWCEGVELELTDEEWRGIMLRAFELHREGRDEVILE